MRQKVKDEYVASEAEEADEDRLKLQPDGSDDTERSSGEDAGATGSDSEYDIKPGDAKTQYVRKMEQFIKQRERREELKKRADKLKNIKRLRGKGQPGGSQDSGDAVEEGKEKAESGAERTPTNLDTLLQPKAPEKERWEQQEEYERTKNEETLQQEGAQYHSTGDEEEEAKGFADPRLQSQQAQQEDDAEGGEDEQEESDHGPFNKVSAATSNECKVQPNMREFLQDDEDGEDDTNPSEESKE